MRYKALIFFSFIVGAAYAHGGELPVFEDSFEEIGLLKACEIGLLPEFSACDDGDADTFPDICRQKTCVGALQGKLPTGGARYQAVDAALTSDGYVVLVNSSSDNIVNLFTVTGPDSGVALGFTTGKGHRLHTKGTNVLIAAERESNTSGGLNCTATPGSPCPLLGIYRGTGSVLWNGEALHRALNGLAMGAVHDIVDFVDVEQEICTNPPCYSDTHWWFAGQRQGDFARPHTVHCLEQNPSTISCTVLSGSYNSSINNGSWFAGAEVSLTSAILDPEYNAGVFGLHGVPDTTVLIDFDADPNDAFGTFRQGPFNVSLNGSLRRACNSVIEYGDGGAVHCSAPNTGGFFGCQADPVWSCANLLQGNDFVQGYYARRAVLVTPEALMVHATGSVADDSSWTPIDFKLPLKVKLAAMAGNNDEWYVFANDSNDDTVIVYRFVWP